MFDLIFAVIAIGAYAGAAPGSTAPGAQAQAQATIAAVPGMDMSVVPLGLVAEDQTPSGKFLTATETKPILDATKASWIAVREYDGQDLIYVTHLWSWRCGLSAVAISINDEAFVDWPLPPCHAQTATPNAILEEDGLPYQVHSLGSVASVRVQVVYDDLSMDQQTYERAQVLLP